MQQNSFFNASFKLALHVLGDIFAHLQEHFDRIYSFLEQYRLPTGDVSRQQTAESVHCSKKLYIQSAPEDGRNCRPKHVEQA